MGNRERKRLTIKEGHDLERSSLLKTCQERAWWCKKPSVLGVKPVTLKVRFYGMFQMVTGLMEYTIEVPERSTLAMALRDLVIRLPRLAEVGLIKPIKAEDDESQVRVPDFVVVAVNGERVPASGFDSFLLEDNDTIHFAPVSIGGAKSLKA